VILAKVADNLSGVEGANIQYEQKHKWVTLPTTVQRGTARAVIPAENPITLGKHSLRIEVTDKADNRFVDYDNQRGKPAVLDYPVAAGLRLLYTVTPTRHDIYGHPAANTGTDSTLRLAYEQAAVITGQLDTTARALLDHEPVKITVRLADGKQYGVWVRTDRRGDWHYRLPAGGDRIVKVEFGGSVGLRASSHIITVRSHAAIRAAVNQPVPGGQMVLSARVLGGGLPAHGLALTAQWRRGINSPWHTLPGLHTSASGVASAHYPAPAVAPGSHIRIRVSAHARPGWAYSGATSSILSSKLA
jgi:hypothetical protein